MNFQASQALPLSGFNYTNCQRNANLIRSGFKPLQPFSTGTTVVALCYKFGVILGAESRCSAKGFVVTEQCGKIFRLADNIFACASGNLGDATKLCAMCASQLQMLKLNTGRTIPLIAATTYIKRMLFLGKGIMKTGFIVGGMDYTGPAIRTIFSYGSTDVTPYSTMGSGGMYAMSILESRWRPNLSKASGLMLITEAITAGILNDPFSGGHVELTVISRRGVEHLQHFIKKERICRAIVLKHSMVNILLRLSKKNSKDYLIDTEVMPISDTS